MIMLAIRIFITALLISLCSQHSFSQIFEWIDTFETEGYTAWLSDIITDANGNAYVSGIFQGTTKIQGTLITNDGRDVDS